MKSLLLAQLIVPIALLAWLVAAPARSALGLIVQLVGSVAVVAAMSVVGLWLFPPWWFPRVVLVGIALVGAWHLYRSPRLPALPNRVFGWIAVVFFAGSSVAGAYALMKARIAARLPNAPETVELAFPLEAGRYLVVNGGTWVPINAHRASMDTSIVRLRPWRGNGHAVDVVGMDPLGLAGRGVLPADPAAYAIYGARVSAPCSGTIVAAVDGVPDMTVPEQDREHMAGNHVIVDCAGVHVVLAHFQPGSVLVRAGDRVETGKWLARVGNSGMSTEPHLHVHAQRPGSHKAPMSGDPLPMRLGGRYLVRGDRVSISR